MSFTVSPEKSVEMFRQVFEEATLGMAVEDMDGRLLLANPALCSMLGFAEEELYAMNCAGFTDPEDSEEDWGLFQKLRAGSIDRYSIQKRYIRKDGARIWGRLSVSRLKSIDTTVPLVCAFVEEITEGKRAHDALRDSEQRYRLLFERTLAGVAISRDDEVVKCNDTWALILGYGTAEEVRGRRAREFYFHPGDRESILEELNQRGSLLAREMPLRRKDGTPVWVLFNASLISGVEGAPMVQATIVDISERKLAEEALAHVSSRLIEAQEQERSRIGRELHDDIGQRLALLAVELQRMAKATAGPAADMSRRMGELWKQTLELSVDVQALSHDLHSSKLQYLGIFAAMRSFCREFGEQQGIDIEFKSHDLPRHLPTPEVSLSLFRVLQEALHNAAKHSGVGRFEVELWGTAGEIHLAVSDFGTGFDIQAARQGRGLGLTSMEERLKIVNGEFSIESQPQRGTIIHARVPISDSRPARG